MPPSPSRPTLASYSLLSCSLAALSKGLRDLALSGTPAPAIELIARIESIPDQRFTCQELRLHYRAKMVALCTLQAVRLAQGGKRKDTAIARTALQREVHAAGFRVNDLIHRPHCPTSFNLLLPCTLCPRTAQFHNSRQPYHPSVLAEP